MELVFKVNRKELVDRLEVNKKRFEETYTELMVVFEAASKTYQKAYAEYSKNVVLGKTAKHPKAPIKPADYTKDYEDYITMFKADVQDTVILDENKMKWLWLDKWEWRYSFSNCVNSYYDLASGTTGLESSANILHGSSQYYKV